VKPFGLQVFVVILDSNVLRFLQFALMLSDELGIDLELGSLSVLSKKDQARLIGESTSKPEEGLLEVVVTPGRQIVVLEVSLTMELNVTGFHLSVLDIDLVSNQHDWDVLTDPNDISMPVRDVLVCDSARDVEHNDSTFTLDIITVSQTTEFLLTGGIPYIEADLTTVSVELQRMNFDAQSWDIFLLKFTGSVALHQSGFSDTTITDEKELKFRCSLHLTRIKSLA
jgi:hypothetical protein